MKRCAALKSDRNNGGFFCFVCFLFFFSSFYQATVASFTQGKLSQQAYNAFNDVVANKKVYDL